MSRPSGSGIGCSASDTAAAAISTAPVKRLFIRFIRGSPGFCEGSEKAPASGFPQLITEYTLNAVPLPNPEHAAVYD
ncbi:hypothetical protein KGMB02707_02640 [Mesosutterella multiformis]|nr:hypothetical protein KGMB02707_02640 [Mesosutterella multiformis]